MDARFYFMKYFNTNFVFGNTAYGQLRLTTGKQFSIFIL